jgi:hypothetical protein
LRHGPVRRETVVTLDELDHHRLALLQRRAALVDPTDLTNHVGPGAVAPPPAAMPPAAAEPGFYRKTPAPRAAAGGGARVDLDVPAFMRKQGGGGSGD